MKEAKDYLAHNYTNWVSVWRPKYQDKVNRQYFRIMRPDIEDRFSVVFTDSQMIGILTSRGIYQPTAPRSAPKKNGIKKADLVAQLVSLVGEDVPSAKNLTMPDLEVLIGALNLGVDTTPPKAV